jgi:hypothetical protein
MAMRSDLLDEIGDTLFAVAVAASSYRRFLVTA